MNISGLKKILEIVDPYSLRDKKIVLVDVPYLERVFEINGDCFDHCDAILNLETNEVCIDLYCESYHNGNYYGNKRFIKPLTKEVIDFLLKEFTHKAVDVVTKQLEEAEKEALKNKAKKIVSDLVSEQTV